MTTHQGGLWGTALEDLSLLLRPSALVASWDLVAWAEGMIHCLICFGVFASSPVEDE